VDAIVRGLAIGGVLMIGCAITGSSAAEFAAKIGSTLTRVRAAGSLGCGIDEEEPEYSTSDDHGSREAFDKDLCQAVAVAVLGPHAWIRVVNYPDDRSSMEGLNKGEVDVVPTLSDDFMHSVGTHVQFTRPVLWDGVGFLVLGAGSAMRERQLSGKKICFIAETTVEESVRTWFAYEHLEFVPFPFQEEGEMEAAFATGNCGALAGDRTRLAETRALLAEHGKSTRLLPETISKDPLAAAVRDDDPQWAAIVNWVMEALVQAEESGLTRANVSSMHAGAARSKGSDPTLWFLLGESHQVGSGLGLEDDWVAQVIEETGNYGEIYERDLGSGSVLKLPRGENALREHGGLMMALPPK
jgi:general L-amino acid transport system substrate-binding protein